METVRRPARPWRQRDCILRPRLVELRLPVEEAAILRRLLLLPRTVVEYVADVVLPAAMPLAVAEPDAPMSELVARLDPQIRATLVRYQAAYPIEFAIFRNAVRKAHEE